MNKKKFLPLFLDKIIKIDDAFDILKKTGILIKIGHFLHMKTLTIKCATWIVLKKQCILCKKSDAFLEILGCLSLSAEMNQENTSDDELMQTIFLIFKRNYPLKTKIGLSVILGKVFGINSLKFILKARLKIFAILANFTHTIVAYKLDNLDSIIKGLSLFNFKKFFNSFKRKSKFFLRKYRFERKLIFSFLSFVFPDKFLFFFWIWIKTKLKIETKSKKPKKNFSELPWWRGMNIREAEIEFYEQNHIFIMSHF